jgi:hypothetical protein
MDDLEDPFLRQTIERIRLTEEIKKSFEHPRSFWEHPLTLLFIGFLFSGVLGAMISMTVQSQLATRERERQTNDAQRAEDTRRYQSSTKALTDFSNALYLRYVRAGMLKSALTRQTSATEIRHRKELYDEALVEQEGTVLSSHLLIREALKEQDYDDWEIDYQRALKPRLSSLDEELTRITDAYLRRPTLGKNQLSADLKLVDVLYDQIRTCNSAIVNAIFRSLSSKQYLSGKTVIDTQQKAKEDVNAQCPAE